MKPLDERDNAILVKRQTNLDRNPAPKVGDWVIVGGDYRRIAHVWPDGYQLTSAKRIGPERFYLGDYGCSYSGALDPAIPAASLTPTGESKPGPVWFFHHDRHVAHNGIDVSAVFYVWKCVNVKTVKT